MKPLQTLKNNFFTITMSSHTTYMRKQNCNNQHSSLLNNAADHIIKIKNSFYIQNITITTTEKPLQDQQAVRSAKYSTMGSHMTSQTLDSESFYKHHSAVLLHKLCKTRRTPDIKLKSASHVTQSTCITSYKYFYTRHQSS
jgi:hypothetical protein